MIIKKLFLFIGLTLITQSCFSVEEEMSLEGALLLKEHRLLSGPSKVKLEVDIPLYQVTYLRDMKQGMFYILPSCHAYPFNWLPKKVQKIALNADFLVHEITQEELLKEPPADEVASFYTPYGDWFDQLTPKTQEFLRSSPTLSEIRSSVFSNEGGPCFQDNESFCRALHPYFIDDFLTVDLVLNAGIHHLLFNSMDTVLMRSFYKKLFFGLETQQVRHDLLLESLNNPQMIRPYIQEVEDAQLANDSFSSCLWEAFKGESEAVEDPYLNARNKYWMEQTLSQVVRLPSYTGLLMYGADHNTGPYSILGHFKTLKEQGSSWHGAVITSIEQVDISKEEAEEENL